jgi:MscS family membrane protein
MLILLLNILAIDWSTLETRVGGERVTNILWCVGIILGTLLIKKRLTRAIARLIAAISNRFTDKSHSKMFCELVHRPLESLIQTILFYVAVNQLGILLNQFALHRYKGKSDALAIRIGDITDHIFLFCTILFSTLLLSRIIDFIYRIQQDNAIEEGNRERQQLLPLVKEMAKILLWVIGLFWVLGTVFHVNIPALITGLGIGGVAIALAAKESVENFFAAFTILTDKPFRAGDSIKLGGLEGTVERIGFRSTRLRNADGSAYIIPNKKLVNENLENLSFRDMRRIKLPVSIKYGISYTDMQKMLASIKQKITAIPEVVAPVEVTMDNFGENVFQVIISYHLSHPLSGNKTLNAVKHEVTLAAYDAISSFTNAVATPPAAGNEDDTAEADDTPTEDNLL